MIHRYLHDLLTVGVAEITADPTLIDELFKDTYELVTAEADVIKAYFAAHPPSVINGYPRQDSAFPLVSIVLDSEQESQTFMGNSGGMIDDEDNEFYQHDLRSAMWAYTYRLMVFTEHPDVTSYYYEIVKFILLDGLEILVDDGCSNFKFAGADLAPDPNYVPAHLYGRNLVFSCDREFQRVDRESRLRKAFQVAGIHVDKGSASSEVVGDVKTNIIPYSE